MSASNQSSIIVAQRYIKALIELAEEQKKLDKVEVDMQALAGMITQSDDLASAIRSPLNTPASLKGAMDALAVQAKFQDITKNFIGVLIDNRRLAAISKIIETFNAELDKRRGAVSVNVEVAHDLTAKQKKDLEAALKAAIGKDVAISAVVKPSILGGMVVTFGSQMIDNSVRRKLERLKVSMGAISNENLDLKAVS